MSKFKSCYIGNDCPICLGLIHITNQTEYDYYSTRGASFFTNEDLTTPGLNYVVDYNKINYIAYIENIYKIVIVFDSITKTFDNVHY